MLFSAQSVQTYEPLFIHEKYNLLGLHRCEGGNEVTFVIFYWLLPSPAHTGLLVTCTDPLWGSGALKVYLRSVQGPDLTVHHVCSLVQPCPLPMKTLERILSLPLLGGPTMRYQSQTKSNASSLGSLRCPF